MKNEYLGRLLMVGRSLRLHIPKDILMAAGMRVGGIATLRQSGGTLVIKKYVPSTPRKTPSKKKYLPRKRKKMTK